VGKLSGSSGAFCFLFMRLPGGVVVSPLKQMVMKVDLDGARTA
jgi:hypothetical protein